ncbi:MAG: leucine-rich repeat protein [Clostridia bacterium]
MKKLFGLFLSFTILVSICSFAVTARAFDDAGDFNYEINTVNSTVSITGYIGVGPVVSIPDVIETFPVVSIGDSAFLDNLDITGVVIPDSVKTIEADAFSGCMLLETVQFGGGLLSIGENAFANCSVLKSVVIPNTVTNLGIGAFNACSELSTVTIGISVASIGESTFLECTSLKTVTIPASVKEIGSMAFGACTGLTTIELGTGITSIGELAFASCILLTVVTIPENVSNIGAGAFSGCEKLVAAIFKGNAPVGTTDMFAETAKSFTVYFDKNTSGFTTPLWKGYKTTSEIYVPAVDVTGVQLNKASGTLLVPKTVQLVCTITPSNATNKMVAWSSSNIKIAKVSTTGLVTAVAPGKATISVITNSGAWKATYVVTVLQPVKSVKLNKSTLTLLKGKSSKLIATITPVNASNKKVTWKSANAKIASVTSNGTVKGIKKGTTYISVYTADGKKSAKCKVIIK